MKVLRIIILGVLVTALPTMGAESGKHLFILSGQSNMRQPLPDSFERAVSAVFGKKDVVVVMHARSGQPIRQWHKNWKPPEGMTSDDKENGTLYDELLSKVLRETKGATFSTVSFIWMQGEADATKGWGAVYERSFLGVLDQLKQDLKLDKINFVLGRISDHYLTEKGTKDGDLVRTIQQNLGEHHDYGDWVNTDDLNRGINPWGIYSVADGHYPPAGYRVLGQRFALKACRLINPELKHNPAVFDAGFMDSHDDIKTHAAIGKTVSGDILEPKHKGAAKLSNLTDGLYGSTDPSDGAWVGCPPNTKAATWVVDLGTRQSVKSVAVNFLVNKNASAGFPVTIVFSASADGKTYHPLHRQRGRKQTSVRFGHNNSVRLKLNAETSPQSLLALMEGSTNARYIQITAKTAESWLFIDEIAVNPVPKESAVMPGKD